MKKLTLAILLVASTFVSIAQTQAQLDYDVVYVRYPDLPLIGLTLKQIPQGEHPYSISGGADLMLLKSDGSEVVLVDCNTSCSVMDPIISFDGNTVYYSKMLGLSTNLDENIRSEGWLYKIDLTDPTYTEVRLTYDTGFDSDLYAGNTLPDDNLSNYRKVRDMAPVPLADGRLLFTSNRAGLIQLDPDTDAVYAGSVQEMYTMDDHDGSLNTPELANMKKLDVAAMMQVQHPMQLKDGRILFSTWQNFGAKHQYAMTALFTIHPDGTNLQQFTEPHNPKKLLDHFVTQLPNEDVVFGWYYPSYDYGFGALKRTPAQLSHPQYLREHILQRTLYDNTLVSTREFDRKGTINMTPHTTPGDSPAPNRSGKYAMPSVAANGNMLVAYSTGYVNYFDSVCDNGIGPNQCEKLKSGIYMVENAMSRLVTDPKQLIKIKDDLAYNEIWPRAVLPYQQMFGVEKPAIIPTDRSNTIGATALMGTSSMINRESAPSVGAMTNADDPFNETYTREQGSGNWTIQGADAGLYTDADIYGVRIIGSPPKPYTSPITTGSALYPTVQPLVSDSRLNRIAARYGSIHSEKWEILGEFALPHTSATDIQGNKDTSWKAKVPADTPLFIQTIDINGMTLNSETTWRGLKAGEARLDCAGCHSHSIEKLAYSTTQSGQDVPITGLAGTPDNDPRIQNSTFDLTSGSIPILGDNGDTIWLNQPYLDIEFNRDIEPIIKASCGSCHNDGGQTPDLNTLTGIPLWRQLSRENGIGMLQTSVFMRKMQARQSLLSWIMYNERLDGRTNETRPDDIDYPNAHPVLTISGDDKRTVSRWIDLGAPVDFPTDSGFEYTDDAMLPVVSDVVISSLPAEYAGHYPVGFYDGRSGLNWATLTVQYYNISTPQTVVNIPINLTDKRDAFDVYYVDLSLVTLNTGDVYVLKVGIQDNAGNQNYHTQRLVKG